MEDINKTPQELALQYGAMLIESAIAQRDALQKELSLAQQRFNECLLMVAGLLYNGHENTGIILHETLAKLENNFQLSTENEEDGIRVTIQLGPEPEAVEEEDL